MAHFADRRAFVRHLTHVRKKRWVVYAKAPFAGPEAVLAYRSRYTHRAAISNRRLIAFDPSGVSFRGIHPAEAAGRYDRSSAGFLRRG
jgi:Putative transposase